MRLPCQVFVVLALSLLFGCGGSLPGSASPRPAMLGDKCGIEGRQSAPLIVDWTSGDRDRLEAAVLRQGSVVVKVSACEVKPLWQCTAPPQYRYKPSTMRREAERIADQQSLYARLPTTAVSLEGRLQNGSELVVDRTTVGRFEVERASVAEAEMKGDCAGATHVVSAVSVGAFEFSAKKKTEVSGAASGFGSSANANASSAHDVLSADGKIAACDANNESAAPPKGCGAPIQVELTPLMRSISVAEYQMLLIEGMLAVRQKCLHHGVQGSAGGLWLFIAPDGRITPLLGPDGNAGPFAGTQAYSCVFKTWENMTVKPFTGLPVLATVAFDIQEGDPATWRRHFERSFSSSLPIPLTAEWANRAGCCGLERWMKMESGRRVMK